ncbi:uncharacterized protein LOC106136208 [Amyelois transitella]|uniref:uncharacterized protein LOC106136208 n=1 Tax=Amyelois transitella TaxID=680683 RepID=UPI00067DDAA1|nr:uncharacterized protein LOC106136208 [Amyelois transitella]
MKFIIFFVSMSVVVVSSQNWVSNSYVLNHQEFFTGVLQETVQELEHREWCNLKLDNIYQTINDSLYNFVVNGTVTYHNGFVVSIQKLDLGNIQNSLTSRTADNVTTNFAYVRGNLNLNDVTVGFDVEASIYNDGVPSVQTYTGTYNHGLIRFDILIQKNLDNQEITVSASLSSLAAGSGIRMIYMPSNNVTEALSRRWVPSNNWTGVGRWGSDHMVPIIMDIVNSRIPFPNICIGCYA